MHTLSLEPWSSDPDEPRIEAIVRDSSGATVFSVVAHTKGYARRKAMLIARLRGLEVQDAAR